MRTQKLVSITLIAAAVLTAIFLHVEIRGPNAALANPPATQAQPVKIKEAPAPDNIQPGGPTDPTPPAADPQPAEPASPKSDPPKADSTPTGDEPAKCTEHKDCAGSDLCDRGVCIPDPCSKVVFSTDDAYGCKVAEMLHFHGAEDGDTLNYLIKLGHTKKAEKKMERFSKELEARARRVYWQTKSYDMDAADVAKLEPAKLREKMEETATVGDLMHLTVRMDQRIYAATHKKTASADEEPAKEETTKK